MNKHLSMVVAVGLLAFAGCRADDRSTLSNETPTAPVSQPDQPSAGVPGVGGGPVAPREGWDREATIDRLSQARCQARERCGAASVMRDHTSFSECVEVARAELRGSFGASTCDLYDDEKLAGCARKASDSACGTESKLSDDCVESKLCK